MSILIKGMKMPMGCYECPFEVWGKCMFIHYNAGDAEPKSCPLVEVPPHGRLIDADALVVHYGVRVEDNYGGLRAMVFKRDIDKAPTIIEAEEGEI